MLGLRFSAALTLLKATYGAQSAIKFFESYRFSAMGGDDVLKLNLAARGGTVVAGYQVFLDTIRKCRDWVWFYPGCSSFTDSFNPGKVMLQQPGIQAGESSIDGGYPYQHRVYAASNDSAEIFLAATLTFSFSSEFELQSSELVVSSNAELTLNDAVGFPSLSQIHKNSRYNLPKGVLRAIRPVLDMLSNNPSQCKEFQNKVYALGLGNLVQILETAVTDNGFVAIEILLMSKKGEYPGHFNFA
ncbi:hypothetical protein DFH09DRAFT_1095786 [Mycena vulgaris]|nr:hypothetical protein DFH09DRAFT_1095786 [Mycena vulgaris]